jgi:hypothetical protein
MSCPAAWNVFALWIEGHSRDDRRQPPEKSSMRVFVYVMTHLGDPNEQGCWGCSDCMGEKRGWSYDAVIGVGGVQAEEFGFRGRVKWIGITPTRSEVSKNGPEVTFQHFRYFKENLPNIPPRLAARIKRAPRGFMSLTPAEQREAKKLLEMAIHAGPSQTLSQTRVKKSGPGHCSMRSPKPHQVRASKGGRRKPCD